MDTYPEDLSETPPGGNMAERPCLRSGAVPLAMLMLVPPQIQAIRMVQPLAFLNLLPLDGDTWTHLV